MAAEQGHKDIVDMLLAHNCSLDLQDIDGSSALIIAAAQGHKDIVDALVAHNCNLDLQDINGETALMIAKRGKHVEIVALIENQLRRNRIWDRRKGLMLVLAGSNYLLPSSSLMLSSAAIGTGRVVQNPVVIQRADSALVTSSEKVLCDLFLVQHIMRYI